MIRKIKIMMLALFGWGKSDPIHDYKNEVTREKLKTIVKARRVNKMLEERDIIFDISGIVPNGKKKKSK